MVEGVFLDTCIKSFISPQFENTFILFHHFIKKTCTSSLRLGEFIDSNKINVGAQKFSKLFLSILLFFPKYVRILICNFHLKMSALI